MEAIFATSRLPFLNPELHAMAFSVLGDHQKAQTAVERAMIAYAMKNQHLDYLEHPWTQEIVDLADWTVKQRIDLMDQLWEILKREQFSGEGFYQLGVNERLALFLRARTPLEIEDIAHVLGLSSSQTVALLERARRELLDRNAPGLLQAPHQAQCRFTVQAEALAALDVERFHDDFLVRHMRECAECTKRYSEAKHRRDAWLAFIPEGTIPRDIQRDFETRLPQMLKDIVPINRRSPSAVVKHLREASVIAFKDLLKAMQRPSFVLTMAGVAILTIFVWFKR